MRTIPVTLVEQEGRRWLVAPYGDVNRVCNARAAGQVTLTRGRNSETLSITELVPQESAPILKEYVRQVPIIRSCFDAAPDAPVEAFAAEAARHPVLRRLGPG